MPLSSWPWRRILTWTIFAGVLYLLRNLFPLLFLTFLFAYVAEKIVLRLTARHPYRRFFTMLVFISFLGMLVLLVSFVGPGVYDQAVKSLDRYARSVEVAPATGDTGAASASVPPAVAQVGERLIGVEAFGRLAETAFAQRMIEEGEKMLFGVMGHLAEQVGDLAVSAARLMLFAFISWILAFIAVWDLPRIVMGVSNLERGPFGRAYREISPMVASFADFIGRAFEAQAVIALVNAILTGVGLWLLGIPEVALLTTIVFTASFIPVFGVIFSTLPITLFALQSGGWTAVMGVICLVLLVHALEAYVINPVIYGHAFESHPLLVLVLLLLGEHFFGIWGLILAVPLGLYVIQFGLMGTAASSGAAPQGDETQESLP